jgi:hypothetical protein
MARLSNLWVTLDSGERQESPAGIVALFAPAYNLGVAARMIF